MAVIYCSKCGNDQHAELVYKHYNEETGDGEAFQCADAHACFHRYSWKVYNNGLAALESQVAEEEKRVTAERERLRVELAAVDGRLRTFKKDYEFLLNNPPDPLCEGEER